MMERVHDEVVAIKTPLAEERRVNKTLPVIGEGPLTAHIMFVGEAPGKKEAATGRPFCGASGKFLDEMLASIGLPRSAVYITNIVKDRPTDNRDPSAEEIKAYGSFLDRQIEIIKPHVIATLGRFSMVYIMQKFDVSDQIEPISKIHGRICNVSTSKGATISIVPLYHPASALYKGSMRATLLEDFKVLKGL